MQSGSFLLLFSYRQSQVEVGYNACDQYANTYLSKQK